jgi:hypothetical protein
MINSLLSKLPRRKIFFEIIEVAKYKFVIASHRQMLAGNNLFYPTACDQQAKV